MTAVHGGDLTTVAREFGRERAALLDFSANVNPLGPPAAVARVLLAAANDTSVLAAYPDSHARELAARIGARTGVPADAIVVANGGAALLAAAVRACAPRRCVVPVPAFSEYAHALDAAGCALVPFALRAADGFALDAGALVARVRASRATCCIVTNPHNPSGRAETASSIAALVRELQACGCTAIVDEAFVDYVPEASIVAPNRPLPDGTVVLRSLTKFYAIPGIRIGYALASARAAARVRAMLPSWPAGTVDQRVAIAALDDAAYAARTLRANADARERFVHALRAAGAVVFEPAANFVLCDLSALCDDATALRERLIREHGVVIRTFPHEPALEHGAYARLAVRRPHENARLLDALAACTRKDDR